MPDELLQRILSVLGDGGGGHQQEAEDGGVHGVTGVTLSRVVSVVTVSRVTLCIRWLACAWLYGHGMVPAPTGQRRWAQELYILDTGLCFHHPSAVTELRRVQSTLCRPRNTHMSLRVGVEG